MTNGDPIPAPTHQPSRSNAWLRLLVGAVLLGLFAAFFASGYSPPGVAGTVLRHNQQYDIDASPLFYTEVDNMAELEAGLAALRADTSRTNH